MITIENCASLKNVACFQEVHIQEEQHPTKKAMLRHTVAGL